MTTTAVTFDPHPVRLANDIVCLEPVSQAHAQGLFDAAQDDSIWMWFPFPGYPTMEAMLEWIDTARVAASEQREIAFVIVDVGSGQVAGSTSYLDIQLGSCALEIGRTWLRPQFQRTAINTNCKWLLLGHAFEELGTNRVCLKTDLLNEQSQRAIERIGAVREGVLRSHMRVHDGRLRDTVYYSVIADEWRWSKSGCTTCLGDDAMEKVSLAKKLSLIDEMWSPKIIGELNGQYVKLVKANGEYVWHQHDEEDELFLVVKGRLTIKLRDRDVELNPGEFFIVPRGVEHKPVAEGEVHVLLFEPAATRNTGNVDHEYTIEAGKLERI